MKYVLITSIVLALTLCIVGCKKEDYNYKVKISKASWSGWDGGGSNKGDPVEYEVVDGKEYNLDNGNFVFTIKKVKSDYIVIETKEAFSDNEKGIDLNTKKKEFKVTFDKEIELTTPTMDAGNTYRLILIK